MTCPHEDLCRKGDACAGHCKREPMKLQFVGAPTPEELRAFGYRIEFGDPSDPLLVDYHNLYWWTWVDPIHGGDVFCSESEWTSLDAAIADARRDMNKELPLITAAPRADYFKEQLA